MAFDMRLDAADSAEIERLIDARGLDNVIDAIADICYGKAEHLRSNWQDENAAKLWAEAGYAVNASLGVKVRGVHVVNAVSA